MKDNQLGSEYRNLLLNRIIPFWKEFGLDHEYGGVRSCMKEDGTRVSDDKYIWSQARWVWVCSALFNRIEPRPEFLLWAKSGIDFLMAHGRDTDGRWIYRTDRKGTAIEGAISIYSDCFAVYACSEYYRATRDASVLQVAIDTFWQILVRVEAENFKETAPYALPCGLRNHGVPMMIIEVANELAQTTGNPAIESVADRYAALVMDRFVQPDNLILEFLDRQYRPVPAPDGTFIMPGHAIECMWFVMHLAARRQDQNTIVRAAEVLKKHLEAAWDSEFGGLFLGLDTLGGTPLLPNSEAKIWWPHTEALYALRLASFLTGETWCKEWYDRIYAWSFSHFPMSSGEWCQRLDRTGQPLDTLIALPVKDPFHLPRAAILIAQLEGVGTQPTFSTAEDTALGVS